MMKYREIVEQLTTEQKLALAASLKSLASQDLAAAGVPQVRYSGPHRMNARCGYALPSYWAMANSWDTKLMSSATALLAARARAEGVGLLFTPEVRVRSDPYQRGMSEDPVLASSYARCIADAVSASGVMPCLSGCGLNAADVRALDKQPDERVLHEYFLPPFDAFLSHEAPAVSAAYTQQTGGYKEVNTKTIQNYLRRAGGDSFIISTAVGRDLWGQCLRTGNLLWSGDITVLRAAHENYLHMRDEVNKGGCSAEELENACACGEALEDSLLDEAADRAIAFAEACRRASVTSRAVTPPEDTAKRAAEESIVLLKNSYGILPLAAGSKLAVIGRVPTPFGGSAEAVFAAEAEQADYFRIVGTAAGYDMAGDRSDDLQEEALALADGCDTVLLFLGTDSGREDAMIANRRVKLPANQLSLLSALHARRKKVIVVLTGGIARDLSFDKQAAAVLLAPVDGMTCAAAIHGVLSGKVNPSGRLAATCYDDPDALYASQRLQKEADRYKIGVFMGYRRYDTAGIPVRYPFGFGLSYTTFEYSSLSVSGQNVSFTVKNAGKRAGAEVAQVYVGKPHSALVRPKKELKAFEKIYLAPGQSRRVTLTIDPKLLAVHTKDGDLVEGSEQGDYIVYVGASVSDIRLTARMRVSGRRPQRDNAAYSDYLPTYTNVLSGGYTFGDIRSKPKKGLGIRRLGFVLLPLGVAAEIAFVLLLLSGLLNGPDTLIHIISGVGAAVIAGLGVLFIAVGNKVNKKAGTKTPVIAKEKKMDDKKAQAPLPYEKLFEELIDVEENAAAAAEEQKKEAEERADTFRYFDPSDTLPLVCERFVTFAAQRGIALEKRAAERLFSAMLASRLVLIETTQQAACAKLTAIMSEFFGTSSYLDDYTGYAAADDMMFRTLNGGFREKTAAARALFDAAPRQGSIYLAALNGVAPEDIAAFFMPFSRYVNFPDDGNTVTLRESGQAENTFHISPNLWFMMVLKEGAALEQTDPYIAKIAAFVRLDVSPAEETERTDMEPLGYYQLIGLSRSARDNFALDEENGWKKIDRLEQYAAKHVAYTTDNKGWTRMEKFSSALLSCGAEQADVLDETVAVQLLLPILTASPIAGKEEDYDLLGTLDVICGEGSAPLCKRILTERIAAR